MTRTSVLAALLLALLGSALAASGASADILTPESGAGSGNADKIDTLYKLVSVLGLIVFIAVEGVLIWSLVKFKAKKGMKAAQIHGNTRLEIGWTVGAAVILVFITAVTFIQLGGIIDPDESDIDANGRPVASSNAALFASTNQKRAPQGEALNIKVDGQQYVWRYQYPGPKAVNAYVEMVVPVGRTVTLDITADDVAHSWWIPALGGKMDALPGYTNKTWFKVTKPGVYRGQCAELCGRNHANMLATVRAVPYPEYQRWYDDRAADVQRDRDEAAKQREALNRAETETTSGAAAPTAGAQAGE